MPNTPNSVSRIVLEKAEHLYEKLKWEAERLKVGWNVFDSINFVFTAHHLYKDWIDKDNCGQKIVLPKKALVRTTSQEKRDLIMKARIGGKLERARKVMQIIFDLSNGTKHWQLEHQSSLQAQIVKKVHKPVIADWNAYFNEGKMIYVDFDKYRISMSGLVNQVLGYFAWIFEPVDSSLNVNLEDSFPFDLLDRLEAWRILK